MNDGELLKTHLFVENELHKASISRNLKRQMLHLGGDAVGAEESDGESYRAEEKNEQRGRRIRGIY